MAALDTLPIVEKTSLFGTGVHAVLRRGDVTEADLRRALDTAGLTVISIERVVPSLEDVFLDVVDREAEAGGAAA